jgi:uncharacterized membrane protein YphA (DoxX/SURF4 family)
MEVGSILAWDCSIEPSITGRVFSAVWHSVMIAAQRARHVHLPAGDTENMINFYKNLVMAGGFLYVINFGAGVLSFDDGVPAR